MVDTLGRRTGAVELESLFDTLDARSRIAEQRATAVEVALQEARAQALRRLRADLSRSKSLLRDAVLMVLPALSLDGFHLVRFERQRGDDMARVVLAVEAGLQVPVEETVGPAGEALRATLERGRSTAWLVMPVEDAEGIEGFVVAHAPLYDVPALTQLCREIAPALRAT